MFQSENAMIVDDALQRIDSVRNLAPLPEARNPKSPRDASVELLHVRYSYDGEKDALQRRVAHHPRRADRRLRRPVGRRQDHAGQPGRPLL